MTKTDDNKPDRLKLHPSQLIAGALAAVTGAALSARLGVAGTLAGTAAISIISGVASAIYVHSVKRTRVAVVTARAKLAELQSTIDIRRIEPDGSPAEDQLSDPEPAQPPFWSRIPRRLLYAGVGALATFVLAIGIITSIELVHGKPLSGTGNGTTITRAFESGGTGQKQPSNPPASDDDSPKPTPSPTPLHSHSPHPSAPQHSTTPSQQPSQSPSQEPSGSSSQQPSGQTSESPSAPESSAPPAQSPSDAPSDPVPTPSDVAPSH